MEPFTALTSTMVVLPVDNIDTDQIIPARFLKTTQKTGLGREPVLPTGATCPTAPTILTSPSISPRRRPRPFSWPGTTSAAASSREHAPWALMDFGFRAVISTSFADIFRNNSLKNGLLPVEVDDETLKQLQSLVAEDAATEITVDLANQRLVLPDGRGVEFPIDGFSKTCLLEGIDQLGYLLKHDSQIAAYEAGHPARVNTTLHPLS